MIKKYLIFGLLSIIIASQVAIRKGVAEGDIGEIKGLNQKRFELYQKGKYEEAVPYAEKVLAIQEKILGKEHLDVATSLDNLGYLYRDIGHYADAEPLYRRALQIREKFLEKDHPSVALSYYNIAYLYRFMGKYKESESLHKKALEIRERVLGQDHPDIAQSLNSFGHLYIFMGNYVEAESLLTRALGIRERTLGKDHLDIAQTLNNLGSLHYSTGHYAEAELFYKKALEMRERLLGRDHPYIAITFVDLGWLYNTTGRYAEAEQMHKRALEIREAALRKDHPDIASSLNNLGWVYYTMRRYDEAEPLLKRSLEIREKAFGKDHPSVAASYNYLARLYTDTKRYDLGESYNKKALEMRERTLGKDHPNVAQSLNNLARLYLIMRRYPEAEKLLKRALEIREKTLGKEHPYVSTSLKDLAQLYAATGRHPESHQQFKRSTSILEKTRENIFQGLSEKQKLNYMQDVKSTVNAYLTHTCYDMQSSLPATVDTFNMWIKWKGAVLEAQGRYMEGVMRSDQPELKEKFDELIRVRREIAKLQLSKPEDMAVEDYIKRLGELEKWKESLEKKLSLLSKDFALEKVIGEADVKRIAELLPKDSVYLDFAQVREYDFKKRRGGALRYFIFLLVPGKETTVKLFNLQATSNVNQHIHAYLNEMAKAKLLQELPNNSVLREEAKTLYRLLLKPIEPYLRGKEKLFISPDGLLNLIPFEVLITPEDKTLMEDYIITYIAAGRDVVRFTDTATAKGDALIIANPDYDMGAKAKDQVAEELGVTKTVRGSVSKDAKGLSFVRLPDTKLEADHIETLLKNQYFQPVKNYQDKKALEEILFSVESPKILHLATHGYFLRDEEAKGVWGGGMEREEIENVPLPGMENPMLRSGIVLAGANTSLREGRDDGVVSAEKILGLRLKGTELVVLSACETGVGEVKVGEGVFGLKRAFILSGAKTVVMSLWSVPSKETTELMTSFYKFMSEGKTKAEALRQAKMDLMKKKPNPFYWGAFVLVGNPQ